MKKIFSLLTVILAGIGLTSCAVLYPTESEPIYRDRIYYYSYPPYHSYYYYRITPPPPRYYHHPSPPPRRSGHYDHYRPQPKPGHGHNGGYNYSRPSNQKPSSPPPRHHGSSRPNGNGRRR